MGKKAFSLSQEQKLALGTFGADVGVSAGAGSGKTTVLVERYLRALLDKGAHPENILAVTFTDKAAQVMKERVRRRCQEEGLREIEGRLDGAWIGTIHSFCSRFLKENPLECGVDPDFTVLGAGEEQVLMDRVLDRLLEEESSSEPCLKLLADHDEDEVRERLRYFYQQRRAHADEGGLLAVHDLDNERMSVEKDLKELCDVILKGVSKAPTGPEERLSQACHEVLGTLQSKKDGWTRWNGVLRPVDSLDRRSRKTRDRVEELQVLAERWGQLQVQTMARPDKEEWLRLLDRFTRMYEQAKRERAVCDFEDLLYLTYRALSGRGEAQRALRQRTQKKFHDVFVDEYQDTSLLQARILELIRTEGNLFMVGDVRQSIYRFRYAHPEIFEDALKKHRCFPLNENYRTRPEILRVVNDIFSRLFDGTHAPLKPRREFTLKKDRCLEWLCVPRDERTLDALRVLEARSVAARIRRLVDDGFLVEEGGRSRPIRYKDIAILMRKSTASRLYEKELEAFSIPYHVNKGRGFYEKAEVFDLINFLRTLEDPSEDLTLASVLRSPLAQLSDDALYWLCRHRDRADTPSGLFPILRKHGELASLSARDQRKLDDFMRLFDSLRGQKDRLKLSELLHRMVDETAYEAKWMTRPDGQQACANIWKLIGLAASVEDRNIRGVSDFTRYLKALSDSEQTESEARVLGEEEDVLRLMTIHAAKGLEFPVVVLADMGGEDKALPKPSFACSTADGMGARLKNPADLQFYEDAAYAVIREREKMEDERESDRLLYVAMTRAKEHLVLSGVLETEKNSEGKSVSWFQKLSRMFTEEERKRTFHTLPVVLDRPIGGEKKERLVDVGDSGADEKAFEKVAAGLELVRKPYEMIEDLTVSQILSVARPSPVTQEPEDTEDDQQEDVSGEVAAPRNEFGTAFHLLMELSTRQTSRGRLNEETFHRVLEAFSEKEKKEARSSFSAFWKGPWGEQVRRAEQVYPELPFIFKTRHGILKGQIDLVYRQKDAGWVILDYKTNQLTTPGDLENARETYSWQLGLYALAFWKLYGEVPKRTVLYFTAVEKGVESEWTQRSLEALAGELEEFYRAVVVKSS